MTTENQELYFNCLMIEALVKSMVVNGETNNAKLVAAVDEQFHPKNTEEMEVYSEAILYAKFSVLN